eukprot:Amastigsp_a339539_451.p4 type:complete len:144 gc:universal Amastigsp_a339539_451:479-48(-)
MSSAATRFWQTFALSTRARRRCCAATRAGLLWAAARSLARRPSASRPRSTTRRTHTAVKRFRVATRTRAPAPQRPALCSRLPSQARARRRARPQAAPSALLAFSERSFARLQSPCAPRSRSRSRQPSSQRPAVSPLSVSRFLL